MNLIKYEFQPFSAVAKVDLAESVCLWLPVAHCRTLTVEVLYNKAVVTWCDSSSYKGTQGHNFKQVKASGKLQSVHQVVLQFEGKKGFLVFLSFYTIPSFMLNMHHENTVTLD